jgi:hypothetical protein
MQVFGTAHFNNGFYHVLDTQKSALAGARGSRNADQVIWRRRAGGSGLVAFGRNVSSPLVLRERFYPNFEVQRGFKEFRE